MGRGQEGLGGRVRTRAGGSEGGEEEQLGAREAEESGVVNSLGRGVLRSVCS